MTLWDLQEQQLARIESISEELQEKHRYRLRELGFEQEISVRCVKKTPFGGPKLYQIGDSVFSLTEDIARAVLLHPKAAQ